jgi:glutathione peroxidase
MKTLFLSLLITVCMPFAFSQKTASIHQFKVKGIDGKTLDFATFKGKKILIVNTASACGYTPQYEGLQKLYTEQKGKLVIVGFPCNQFGGQESGTETTIQAFCKKNYGVTFPLSSKIDVKGAAIAPIYKWLCNKTENGILDATIRWNFNKFLLDENGTLLAYFPSNIEPDSDEILKLLK